MGIVRLPKKKFIILPQDDTKCHIHTCYNSMVKLY
nr:MAG TPA: hypothetical protein [Caudoviricetes sp.]